MLITLQIISDEIVQLRAILSAQRPPVKYFRPNTESFGYENQSKHLRLDHVVKSYNNQFYKVRRYSVERLPSVAVTYSVHCDLYRLIHFLI